MAVSGSTGATPPTGAPRLRVVLVHGLGRTPLSMLHLGRDLRRAGHIVTSVGYVAAVEPYARIVARVRRALVRAAESGEPCAAVGHSLGGLLLRAALADWPASLPLPVHVVMLGTPNAPPRLAARLHGRLVYRLVNGECGQLLARPEFFTALPTPAVPCTIVAGTRGWRGRWSPFGADPNDGIVAVTETRLTGDARLVELPVRHTFMMNHRAVRAVVRDALARV